MQPTTATEITQAYDYTELIDVFLLFAPYMLGIAGLLIGISLLVWGFKKVRFKLEMPDTNDHRLTLDEFREQNPEQTGPIYRPRSK